MHNKKIIMYPVSYKYNILNDVAIFQNSKRLTSSTINQNFNHIIIDRT